MTHLVTSPITEPIDQTIFDAKVLAQAILRILQYASSRLHTLILDLSGELDGAGKGTEHTATGPQGGIDGAGHGDYWTAMEDALGRP